MRRVVELRKRGVALATTDRNAAEAMDVLIGKVGLSEAEASDILVEVLRPFELIATEEYDYLEPVAAERLREGGQSDWPVLAAAMAVESDIWSDDVDFFGTGVPVWATPNVRFVEAGEA